MKKRFLAPLAAVAVGIIAHVRWFNGFWILVNGDWQVRHAAQLTRYFAWPNAWKADGFGGPNLDAPFQMIAILHAAFSGLGFGFGVIERLQYLWPLAILMPLGMFLLVRKLTKSDLAAFIASGVYAYNVCFILLGTQHLYIALADAFAPFALLAYLETMERKTAASAALAGFAFFAVSASDFRIFYMLAGAVALFVSGEVLRARAWRHPREFGRVLLFGFAPVALALAMNAYWIIGFAGTGTLASNKLLDRSLFGPQFNTLPSVMALWSGGWSGGLPTWFGTNPVPWWFWWVPLAALGGLYTARKKTIAIFFGLLTAIGLFLSKQTDAPFTAVYPWLYAHFPGFNAFREASKFRVLFALGYAVLIGYGAAWLAAISPAAAWRKTLRAALLTLAVALPLFNAIPLISGDIGTLYQPKTWPTDYATFNRDVLANEPESFRTIWLPKVPQWVQSSPDHPRVSAKDIISDELLARLYGNGPTSGAFPALSPDELFLLPRANAYLDLRSVRYVGVALDETFNDDPTFDGYPVTRDAAIATLRKATYLTPITDSHDGGLVVFKNQGARPRFYVTTSPDLLSFPAEYAVPETVRTGTNSWQVQAKATDLLYLYLTDDFHPGWTVVPSKNGSFAGLFSANNAVPGIIHSESDAGANVWTINVVEACKRLSCESSADGTVLRFNLRFAPQSYFDLGTVLSLLTAAACFAVLLRFAFFRHRSKK